MGRGWRRAFCTSVGRDDQDILQGGGGGGGGRGNEQLKSRRLKLVGGGGGFFSSSSSTSSNPSTPRLQTPPPESPRPPPPLPLPPLQCKTTTTTTTTTTTPRPEIPSSNNNKHHHHHTKDSPRLLQFSSSSPSGTRSPSRFALFKTALRLSRSRCGICAGSVTSSGDQRRTAVFTAECSHVFHFPCISAHVRTHSSLVCPVCSASWHEVPLLSSSLHNSNSSPHPTLGNHDDKNKNSHRQRHRQAGASAVCKVYDDDESLQPSPTSRSTATAAAAGSSSSSGSGGGGCGVQLQFNPIPEEEEEEEVEDEEEEEEEEDINAIDDEKQGGGGGGGGDLHNRQQRTNTIHVMAEATALLSTERSHQIYVVAIKVKAPSIPPNPAAATTTSTRTRQAAAAAAAAMSLPPSLLEPSQRAPIDLVTVLDASGSMTAPKLQMLKRAMRLLISSLGPADRLSIVAFSNVAAKRLLPLRRMSRQGQRSARQIVDRLVVCGSNQNTTTTTTTSCSSSSCAGDALRKATKVLEDRRERNPVATIMLLSDGHGQQQQQQQHNRLQHNSSSSSSQCSATRFAHLEIPIHDSTSPAQQQQYVKQRILAQADDEDDAALAKCVNGLVSVVLQDVNLQFAFPSGIISSVYSYTTQGRGSGAGIGHGTIAHGEGGKSVRLGDMYAGEERELLVEIRVPKTVIVGNHHHAAASLSMSVLCRYRDPVTRELIQCGERPLAIVLGMSTLPYPSQSGHQPTLLRSSSSSSSSSAAITTTATATATIKGSQEEQLLLRNLFVITRAMAESRRLVDLNQLDMAVNLISSARTLILKQSNSSNITTNKKFLVCLETELAQLLQQQQQQRQQQHPFSPSQRRSEQAVLLAETSRSGGGGGGEQPLTPTSAWRAAEQLAKVAIMRKSLNRVSDLHGLENARF